MALSGVLGSAIAYRGGTAERAGGAPDRAERNATRADSRTKVDCAGAGFRIRAGPPRAAKSRTARSRAMSASQSGEARANDRDRADVAFERRAGRASRAYDPVGRKAWPLGSEFGERPVFAVPVDGLLV